MSQNNPLLSIIVPVYNTEQYLSQCIESVLNQSFNSFELLLIDDGSKDGSGDICDEYAKKDSRIRVFHKENGGVSSARNLGLDNVLGEWVFFFDGDDLLPGRALEALMIKADCEVDVVYGGIRKFNSLNDNVETILINHEGAITIEEAIDAFVVPEVREGDWQRYLVNRIYRMSIINKFKLRFHSGIYYKEDGLFLLQYLCRCKQKAVCVSDIVYLYRLTSSSAMGSLKTGYNAKLLTNVDSHGLILRELNRRGVSKSLREREIKEIFQNYKWIYSVMQRSGELTPKNEHLLRKTVVKNAGVRNSIRYFYLPRLIRKLKKCLS